MKFLSTSNSPTEKENLKCLTRKHIAERQRRARINFLLEQLETLILPQDSEPSPVKLEKAEVLEKTVDYIKKRRTSDLHGSRAEYEKGYKECLRKVFNYIDSSTLAPPQKNNIRECLLSQQVSPDQPMEIHVSESTGQLRHHRLPRQSAVTNLSATVQYIKQEAEVVHCQSNPLETLYQYQIQGPQEHITMSPIHLQVSTDSYPLSNNQLPVSHFQLPVTFPTSQTYEGLLSTTTGRHMQIMNTGATQFCEQSGSGITDSNVWRPW